MQGLAPARSQRVPFLRVNWRHHHDYHPILQLHLDDGTYLPDAVLVRAGGALVNDLVVPRSSSDLLSAPQGLLGLSIAIKIPVKGHPARRPHLLVGTLSQKLTQVRENRQTRNLPNRYVLEVVGMLLRTLRSPWTTQTSGWEGTAARRATTMLLFGTPLGALFRPGTFRHIHVGKHGARFLRLPNRLYSESLGILDAPQIVRLVSLVDRLVHTGTVREVSVQPRTLAHVAEQPVNLRTAFLADGAIEELFDKDSCLRADNRTFLHPRGCWNEVVVCLAMRECSTAYSPNMGVTARCTGMSPKAAR